MTALLPNHPYPVGMRVHEAAEETADGHRDGTAEIVAVRAGEEGAAYVYDVAADRGGRQEWPSYFTIPAGLWCRGPRHRRSDAPNAASVTGT
ncbi:hypothetical protein [Nocardiopsis coralliicola]